MSNRCYFKFDSGGPGSGKGTQCTKIASDFGFAHLSAGDLLRHEIASGSEKGELILDIIKEGRIVPSEITVELIRKAMETSSANKVLIDGFPRSEENRIAFERIVGREPDIVVFFDCPEDEMVKRLLGRNQGRVDDNIETIKKRLKVFESLNIPVVDYYSSRGKVCKINAMGTADEIFEAVRKLFSSLSAIWPHDGLHAAITGGLNSETDKYCLLNRKILNFQTAYCGCHLGVSAGVCLKVGAILSWRTKEQLDEDASQANKRKESRVIGMTRLRLESFRVVIVSSMHVPEITTRKLLMRELAVPSTPSL
ncbi:hypothetical protein C2845_PM16G00190 [Panicum miliaceum]|uniref:adenylate kinase n=1 Tax=Panicum miliaceum TaxID=4540 RepID=A0A3L6PUB9_PANMI|nr:hypothetical protein C2845_PM16G00190 [Panicum miliaceum]